MLSVETIDSRVAFLTFDEYRSCWLVRDHKTILIECGYPSDHRMLVKGLAKLGLAPGDIDCLALTHIHLDHAGGAGQLVQLNPNLTVYVHKKGAVHLSNPARLLNAAKKVHKDRMAIMGTMLPVPEKNLRIIDTGSRINLGDTQLNVYHTPGHARHHVVFYHPDSTSVFAGDALGAKFNDRPNFILTPPGDYDKHLAKKSIRRIQALALSRINFTHGGPYRLSDKDSFFNRLCHDHDRWTQYVADLLAENPTIDSEALWNAFLSAWSELESYPDQHFSFRLSVKGIRAYLERTGLI